MLHHSSSGGFYTTEESAPFTILRLKDGMDTAQPSTNGVSASNLFRLAALLGNESYSAKAKETVNAFEVEILQYPWLFVSLLAAVVTARLGVSEVGLQEGEEVPALPRAEARVFRRSQPRGVEQGDEASPAAERAEQQPGVEGGQRGGEEAGGAVVDVEKQCAVVRHGSRPCTASLACKRHSMHDKRVVAGRSAPYDHLLAKFMEDKGESQGRQQS
jgi:uncharacterized protein YyaL (SSP411 family)